MTKTILITRPQHDRATKYLNFLSGEAIKEIEKVGEYTIIDLDHIKAVRKEFEKALDKANPRLIILNGHGSYNSVLGHNNEVILDNNNIYKLNSKIIVAIVCDSALQLGKFAIENGNADSYIGYAANFMIITEESRTTTPHKDKNFKPFMEVYVTLIFSLVSGLTTGESVKKTKNHIRNLIKDYGILGIRDKYGDAPLIRFGLYWDLFYLKVLGKENSVI